jgi:hypothetical protein
MERRRDFGKCHRCGLDITTGEGERDSRRDGAYLPLDLDEYCDTCRLTFFTCEADRPGRLLRDLAHDPIEHAEVTSEEMRRQEAIPGPLTGRMANRLGEPEIGDER